MLLAVEQRARHRQIEGIATITNPSGGQIGPEARGNGARQHALILLQGDDATVRRLVALHDPAGDLGIGHLVKMGAEIRRRRGVRRFGRLGSAIKARWPRRKHMSVNRHVDRHHAGRVFDDNRRARHRGPGLSAAQMQNVAPCRQQPPGQRDIESMPSIANAG